MKQLNENNWHIVVPTNPATLPKASIIDIDIVFSIIGTHVVLLGHFDGKHFVSFDTETNLVSYQARFGSVYNVEDVECFIYISEFDKHYYPSIDTDLSAFDDRIAICKNTIGPNSDYHTLEKIDDSFESNHKKELSIIPDYPDCIKYTSHQEGKYMWCLMDNSDGFYTYNIYKKFCWFFWKTIKAIEVESREAGYKEAEKYLSKYTGTDNVC